ncbi:hypothetical protein SAY86_028455 [Trapa natans]|uniref:GAGA-binding transcriptional activator n=1 Tax=Trapa natans TaxID=22666 RepID=A0AAN7R8M7_TRANT|nr:hypothetical protein SAY86_028455 [Trapa natans]
MKMEDGGHRENGRHKPDHQYKPAQGQWLMQPQPSMKQIMGLMAERDAAIQDRNLALSEKKAAIAERDLAFHQRDVAIAERNNAIMERDNAIAALQYRENSLSGGGNSMPSSCPPGCQGSRGLKHIHHHSQMPHHMDENPYETNTNDTLPKMSPGTSEATKPGQGNKRLKEAKAMSTPTKKASRPSTKKVKKESEDLPKMMNEGGDISKSDWKVQDLGLNLVTFDDTTMPVPICSCTGVPRHCYKWGSGGWQSSCCTTTLSVYPLPPVPNKKHARVGGRKMSGGAFSKLLSRLAAEGHDLTNAVDLKYHWAKHGTNRYITIK